MRHPRRSNLFLQLVPLGFGSTCGSKARARFARWGRSKAQIARCASSVRRVSSPFRRRAVRSFRARNERPGVRLACERRPGVRQTGGETVERGTRWGSQVGTRLEDREEMISSFGSHDPKTHSGRFFHRSGAAFGLRQAACSICPDGSQPSSNRSVCVPCPPGFAGTEGLCSLCPEAGEQRVFEWATAGVGFLGQE